MTSLVGADIVFRVDASLQIGTGHVRRCLTLAHAMRAEGAKCRFITRAHTGNLAGAVADEDFDVAVLPAASTVAPLSGAEPAHAPWLGVDWRTDAQQTLAVLDGSLPDWIVVDHYALDARWESLVLERVDRLMVIDDLADRAHVCSLLLDQNLGRAALDYKALLADECAVLTGPQYALLRPEFEQLREQSLRRREEPALQHLLIAMGGVDQPNATGMMLAALDGAAPGRQLRTTVVMGATAPWLAEVRAQVASMRSPASLLVDTRDMAALMCESDLAIGAAGSSSWERCCLGLPTLLVVLADNQRPGARMLESSGAACLLGEPHEARQRLVEGLSRFAIASELATVSRRASRLVDGKGVQRVLHEMAAIHA